MLPLPNFVSPLFIPTPRYSSIQVCPHRPAFRSCATSPSSTSNTIQPRIHSSQDITLDKSFRIFKTVFPADSDYSSALWHGAYVRYLEEARVRYLLHCNFPYEKLVSEYQTELVVYDLNIRYLLPAKMGDNIYITVRQSDGKSKLRMVIDSEFRRNHDHVLIAKASVILVPVNTQTGKLRRAIPKQLIDALENAKTHPKPSPP